VLFFFIEQDLRDAWMEHLGGALALTPADLDRIAGLLR
jgi:hypothetical protein